MIIIIIIALACLTLFFLFRKKSDTVTSVIYGPFTIKMNLSSHQRLNMNLKMVREQNVAYSVWYGGKEIQYPYALQDNTGYAYVWRVFILDGAPRPTLIAGSQSLFMITEEKNKAVVTPLDVQNSDFASYQYLDEKAGQPGEPKNVYMADGPDSILTIKGGDFLLLSMGMILHVPDLQMTPILKMNQLIDNYNFLKVGGAVSFSPDKKSLVFMASKINDSMKYDYAMIVYNYLSKKIYALPYDRTLTRSIDLNYEDRNWFNTYFSWTNTNDSGYALTLKKFDKLPPWQGMYKDDGKVYQLTPVKNELQQVFVDFILDKLALTKAALLPPEQYHENSVIIQYKDQKLDVWLRPEDHVIVLMLKDPYVPEAKEGIQLIHRLGDEFNTGLAAGKYQEYFTQL